MEAEASVELYLTTGDKLEIQFTSPVREKPQLILEALFGLTKSSWREVRELYPFLNLKRKSDESGAAEGEKEKENNEKEKAIIQERLGLKERLKLVAMFVQKAHYDLAVGVVQRSLKKSLRPPERGEDVFDFLRLLAAGVLCALKCALSSRSARWSLAARDLLQKMEMILGGPKLLSATLLRSTNFSCTLPLSSATDESPANYQPRQPPAKAPAASSFRAALLGQSIPSNEVDASETAIAIFVAKMNALQRLLTLLATSSSPDPSQTTSAAKTAAEGEAASLTANDPTASAAFSTAAVSALAGVIGLHSGRLTSSSQKLLAAALASVQGDWTQFCQSLEALPRSVIPSAPLNTPVRDRLMVLGRLFESKKDVSVSELQDLPPEMLSVVLYAKQLSALQTAQRLIRAPADARATKPAEEDEELKSSKAEAAMGEAIPNESPKEQCLEEESSGSGLGSGSSVNVTLVPLQTAGIVEPPSSPHTLSASLLVTADACFLVGKYREATNILRHVFNLCRQAKAGDLQEPNLPRRLAELFYQTGRLRHVRGQVDRAADDYRAALQYSAGHRAARLNLAVLQAAEDRDGEKTKIRLYELRRDFPLVVEPQLLAARLRKGAALGDPCLIKLEDISALEQTGRLSVQLLRLIATHSADAFRRGFGDAYGTVALVCFDNILRLLFAEIPEHLQSASIKAFHRKEGGEPNHSHAITGDAATTSAVLDAVLKRGSAPMDLVFEYLALRLGTGHDVSGDKVPATLDMWLLLRRWTSKRRAALLALTQKDSQEMESQEKARKADTLDEGSRTIAETAVGNGGEEYNEGLEAMEVDDEEGVEGHRGHVDKESSKAKDSKLSAYERNQRVSEIGYMCALYKAQQYGLFRSRLKALLASDAAPTKDGGASTEGSSTHTDRNADEIPVLKVIGEIARDNWVVARQMSLRLLSAMKSTVLMTGGHSLETWSRFSQTLQLVFITRNGENACPFKNKSRELFEGLWKWNSKRMSDDPSATAMPTGLQSQIHLITAYLLYKQYERLQSRRSAQHSSSGQNSLEHESERKSAADGSLPLLRPSAQSTGDKLKKQCLESARRAFQLNPLNWRAAILAARCARGDSPAVCSRLLRLVSDNVKPLIKNASEASLVEKVLLIEGCFGLIAVKPFPTSSRARLSRILALITQNLASIDSEAVVADFFTQVSRSIQDPHIAQTIIPFVDKVQARHPSSQLKVLAVRVRLHTINAIAQVKDIAQLKKPGKLDELIKQFKDLLKMYQNLLSEKSRWKRIYAERRDELAGSGDQSAHVTAQVSSHDLSEDWLMLNFNMPFPTDCVPPPSAEEGAKTGSNTDLDSNTDPAMEPNSAGKATAGNGGEDKQPKGVVSLRDLEALPSSEELHKRMKEEVGPLLKKLTGLRPLIVARHEKDEEERLQRLIVNDEKRREVEAEQQRLQEEIAREARAKAAELADELEIESQDIANTLSARAAPRQLSGRKGRGPGGMDDFIDDSMIEDDGLLPHAELNDDLGDVDPPDAVLEAEADGGGYAGGVRGVDGDSGGDGGESDRPLEVRKKSKKKKSKRRRKHARPFRASDSDVSDADSVDGERRGSRDENRVSVEKTEGREGQAVTPAEASAAADEDLGSDDQPLGDLLQGDAGSDAETPEVDDAENHSDDALF